MNNESYNKYSFLIDWLIHPNRFFTKLNQYFVKLPGIKKTALFLLSFLIPLVVGLELYLIWTQFAISVISERIVPTELVFVILLGGVLILSQMLLILLPGHGFKRRINKTIHQQTMKLSKNNNSEKDSPKREVYEVKIFSRLYLIRNNLYFTPAAVVLLAMSITNISRTWNIYLLGTYLTVTFWILLLWTGYFAFTSLYSVGVEHPQILKPKITKKQLAFKGAILLGIYIGFVVGLTVVFNWWIGAEGMPLWYKIAMFLLHGN
ncbi:MAG: hypothetical protein HWN65_18095 [Candidatus Helarchaeota archaeon]|nr:hypothetical protein [Candidatus Helarchaeota archaeon]